MNTYTIDLSLHPTTFDLWHVCLAGTAALLALILIVVLVSVLLGMRRCKSAAPAVVAVAPQPEIKIVEKIVEVEKIVQAPAPEPVVLKEATPDAALQLLSLLQKEARFIDFIKEDVSAFSDAEIGAAARVVHQGCSKAVSEHFTLAPVSNDLEGNRVTLNKGFDAASFRLTGNIVGEAPFTGTLVHKGWQVTDLRLPKLTEGHNAKIVAPAEVEL
ncbi:MULTISPECIES: DUF2760 domain-containing protein [Methylomonas]|uniref:DUF2760 domain-containing protein n=2 Tax=Methylomonas TaxID=416 RepID=A0A140E5N8_9GAMM|nr:MULTISPECIES: DUF2760 domain-containing protein [Methylomonas]AMK78712.1 hypothetical protein JT25_019830 [Methylomonas denitrificans]OAH96955.1 hypothetical protein A1342_04880 [Methylomonas methanica]TCV83535.1 uncharacterized protein DUF2760 [Methylomonas methanica]